MLALQGQSSRDILAGLIETGALPDPFRNELSIATLALPDPAGGKPRLVETRIGRTGYTGEPLCFELFVAAEHGPALWDALVGAGAAPVGLGARATPCVSRPACPFTGTSSASTRTAWRSPS